ncbi:MAG TPA: NAD(P)-dependent alcohol dehydrogenase [Acidimicrobiia bacterium]|nr:NAD(P)-dependent alcohol dehydrogenase [Acidimicrobiia bacterium]
MRALAHDVYGSADVLELRQVPRPEVGSGDVLVRVHATALDRGVWHIVAGRPLVARLALGLRRPKNPIPGRDVAGVVEAVGADVTEFRPGDEVFGSAPGAFAEYARTAPKRLAHKPAALTFEHAAALSISGATALLALRDKGRVQAGQRVLIIGASGGVGTYAVQLAKVFGAHVTGVCSAGKADLVLALGADEVLDYARDDIGHDRYDLVLDIAGNRSLRRLRRVLQPRGTLVIVGGEGGDRFTGGLDRNLRAAVWSLFLRQRMNFFVASERGADFATLGELAAAGRITPAIEEVVPLEGAPDALRRMEEGSIRGKVAISLR